MRIKSIIVAMLIGMLFLSSGVAGDEPQKKVMDYLAVMDLNCGTALSKENCTALTNVIITEILKIGKYKVVDRANRDKILSEAGFQQTGCVDESCTIDMGRVMGVGKMVVGSVTKIGATYLVNLQLLNVETATVEISSDEECECELNGLIKAIRNAARKLMGEVPQEAPTSQAQPTPSPSSASPSADQIKFIAATPEQQKTCPENMVYIPAGWFMMGCNAAKDQQCQAGESPYHAVYLDAYCIDKYEYPNQAGAKPKVKVNWNDALGICSSQGKRLPTEAQWEKAARGTDGRLYPWGDYVDDEKADALKNKYKSGTYPWNVSPYGAYDMSGNMWEWVADWYDENYYQSSPNRNPTGATSAQLYVLRGGSWLNAPNDLRSSLRSRDNPTSGGINLGFRCARTQ